MPLSRSLQRRFLLVVVLFGLHAIEEYATGFYGRDGLFLALLRLFPATGEAAFVVLEFAWLSSLGSLYLLSVRPAWARKLLWPLSLLSVLELQHLASSLLGGRYFPGAVSGVFLAAAGVALWSELRRGTGAAVR